MNFTGTPRRAPIASAMSGDTPVGSPFGALPVTSRKLPILIAARSTPVGASSATIFGSGIEGSWLIRLRNSRSQLLVASTPLTTKLISLQELLQTESERPDRLRESDARCPISSRSILYISHWHFWCLDWSHHLYERNS